MTDDPAAALRALRESEQRFRAFVAAGSDMVYRMSPDWSEMRRLDGRDILADTAEPDRGWRDVYIHPDHLPTVEAAIARAIASRSVFELTHRARRADGSLGWVLSRAVPILGPGGEITEWLGAGTDVTDRANAAAALRDSEALRRAELERQVAERTAELEESRNLLRATMDASADMIQVLEAARDRAGEARVRDGEDRFRGLVQGFAQAVWETDAEGRVVTESPSWLAFTGQAAGRSAGAGWLDAVHPDDRADVERRWRDAVVAKRVLDIEYRLRDAVKGWRWTNARAVPLPGEDGSVAKWVGINIDVSERREAQEQLRESEERFRQFAESSSDVIWIRDADTLQFEYVSPAIDAIYGLAPEEFSARHNDLKLWAELLLPDDRARALDAFRRVRGGERVTHEFRIRRPDDGERWIRNTDFPLLDASGRVQRIAGIGEDVTDLKRAEAAIAESETRLRTLTEGIPQLVWRSCAKGKWTWASPQWLDFTGQTQEQTHHWGWLDAVHPDDRFATIKAWEAARPHGMLDVEYRVFRARDRAWVWHHTRSVPVRDADGTIIEWLGTSTDIQGLRELQERQGVLVAELQHRTRNLIGVVRSMADKSLRASADLPDFRDRFGHRMQALSRVQGLLSRLNEGERVMFDALLGAELEAMDAVDDPRVALDGPGNVALRSGTVQTLALALHELATNAIKYGALGQANGRLRVAWRVLPPDEHPRPRLLIEWRESGVSMPPAGSPPRGTGQGRELIERALPYQLDAKTTYVFGDDGVECSILIPISSRLHFEEPTHG